MLCCLNFKAARCSIRIELVGDNFSTLRGELAGPPDTPYEGIEIYDVFMRPTSDFNVQLLHIRQLIHLRTLKVDSFFGFFYMVVVPYKL